MKRALFLAVSLAVVAPARAQSVEAETLFVEGERHMAAGKLDEACAAFAASNRIEPRAGTLLNLGICHEKRGKLASAWSAFREALTRVKDPAKKQFATERAAAIEPRMSALTIELRDPSVPGLVITRDGQPVDAAVLGRAVPVDGGEHRVEARAAGYTPWRADISIADERDRQTVLVPPLAREPERDVRIVAPPPAQPIERTNHHTLALVAGSVGVAALAAGVWAGIAANNADADARAACPDPTVACDFAARANDLIDTRDQRALLANIGFGVAAASAVVVVIALVTGSSDDAPASVAVIPHADGAAVHWNVRF